MTSLKSLIVCWTTNLKSWPLSTTYWRPNFAPLNMKVIWTARMPLLNSQICNIQQIICCQSNHASQSSHLFFFFSSSRLRRFTLIGLISLSTFIQFGQMEGTVQYRLNISGFNYQTQRSRYLCRQYSRDTAVSMKRLCYGGRYAQARAVFPYHKLALHWMTEMISAWLRGLFTTCLF